jgi:hypothetical protein
MPDMGKVTVFMSIRRILRPGRARRGYNYTKKTAAAELTAGEEVKIKGRLNLPSGDLV